MKSDDCHQSVLRLYRKTFYRFIYLVIIFNTTIISQSRPSSQICAFSYTIIYLSFINTLPYMGINR